MAMQLTRERESAVDRPSHPQHPSVEASQDRQMISAPILYEPKVTQGVHHWATCIAAKLLLKQGSKNRVLSIGIRYALGQHSYKPQISQQPFPQHKPSVLPSSAFRVAIVMSNPRSTLGGWASERLAGEMR